ncbi:hypothetical protein HID58_060192 [Brassica napus]|uniref:BnaCnng04430D protein n=2 Tax=Brassica napus TaxID=3708 RepID=A0A078FKR9_BRANA|nr:hypothetical protein HID58_060192 [Brassica napus]CAF1838266.1 unnamed protein product [Brassica napus]CDY15040.1 BnaCnng04430D [Brassica napus]
MLYNFVSQNTEKLFLLEGQQADPWRYLLFVSLLFLPALYSIDYEYCDKSGYDFGNVSYVDITPNPVGKEDKATLMIFGFAKNSIYGGYVGVSVKAGDTTYNVARYPLCVLVSGCSIKA